MPNFIGPNDGQGITLYYDGAQVAGDTTKTAVTKSIGDGRIVVGRYYTDRMRSIQACCLMN